MHSLTEQLINGPTSPLQRFDLTCDPLTMMIVGGGMQAGQAGMDIYGQFQARDTHKAVEESRRQQQEINIEENRRRATHDYIESARLEQTQQAQEEESVAMQSFDIAQGSRRSTATGMASAAERGIAGRTVEQIAADFDFMANEEAGRLKQNQQISNQQHRENIRAMGTEHSNRIASVKPYIPTPAAPIDFFGPIFKAGAQTLGGSTNIAQAAGGWDKVLPTGGSGGGGSKSNPLKFPSSVGVDPKYL